MVQHLSCTRNLLKKMNGECATDGDCGHAIPIILKLQLAMTNKRCYNDDVYG